MREAISVQSSCQDNDKVWQGMDDWGTIERFKLSKTDLRRSTGFVQYQSGHYDDLHKNDTHFGLIGGKCSHAWNGSAVREYSRMVGGPKAKCMKNISRFKLEGAFKEMGNAFRNSPEIFAGIAGPQLGTFPFHLSTGSYFFAWSVNLSIAMHADPDDTFQSFAVLMISPKENPSALGYNKVKAGGGDVLVATVSR